MRIPTNLRSSALPAACALLTSLGTFVVGSARAVMPFTEAKVTRLQNKVEYGPGRGVATRPARVADLVKADNYLLTETDSRAELQYPDGTLVRIGQNTVFTFEAESRTLTLEKGSLIFHIPKGSGGGTIRTASITAAITGTVGKVSPNLIAILEGEITLIPSGRKVPAGSFARANLDGSISILPFDVNLAGNGVLMNFNGPMPGYDEAVLLQQRDTALGPNVPDLSIFNSLDRTQNSPSAIKKFFPDVIPPKTKVDVPPPAPTNNLPPPTDGGRPGY
ncbi:MAG: FecR family protein [Chthoniobacteraceae bacterium]